MYSVKLVDGSERFMAQRPLKKECNCNCNCFDRDVKEEDDDDYDESDEDSLYSRPPEQKIL